MSPTSNFAGRDIVSVRDLSRSEIDQILESVRINSLSYYPFFHVNDVLDLVQKPSVDTTQPRYLVYAYPKFQSFCHVEDSLIGRLSELFPDPLDTSSCNPIISQLLSDVEHSDCLLQRLFEASSDRHDFANGFHLGPDTLADFAELLEIPSRGLDYNVVQCGFETRRGYAGYLVREFWENVAKG